MPVYLHTMKILILAAHPHPSRSVVQAALLQGVRGLEGVTIHDLYAAYPDFAIDVNAEQARLADHDLIVFQHPLYWYSAPALLKEWIDQVLQTGWAHGEGGTQLAGKFLLNAVSTGSDADTYGKGTHNRFSVADFLKPFNQTACLCGMGYLAPFVVYGGRKLSTPELVSRVEKWRDLVIDLRDGHRNPRELLAPGFIMPGTLLAPAVHGDVAPDAAVTSGGPHG